MIRVGFIIEDNGWFGGLNYYRNLLNAICEMPDRKIEPVIFTGSKVSTDLFKGYPEVEIVRTSYLDRLHPKWILHKIGHYVGHDVFLERFLKKYKIDLLSHSAYLSNKSSLPTLGWIPDFQCIHLPNLFTPKQRTQHKQRYKNIAKLCTAVLLSSYDAQKDFINLAPEYAFKSKVLQFVVRPPHSDDEASLEKLESKYKFSGNYFFVPNQFWAHKNHRIIIDALRILKQRNIPILVLATGETKDFRNLEYFDNLMSHAQECDVCDMFRVLGKVPYADVVGLMKNCLSVINPSLFEGWSTTVEEAKSLGKQIILSDIAIHREQNPNGGVYFNPQDPLALAENMQKVWLQGNSKAIRDLAGLADKELAQRWQNFSKTYEKIVLDILSKNIS